MITQSAREHQHLPPAFQPSTYLYIFTLYHFLRPGIHSKIEDDHSQSHVKSSACMFHYLLLKSAHCNAIYYRHISADIHSMPSNLIFSRCCDSEASSLATGRLLKLSRKIRLCHCQLRQAAKITRYITNQWRETQGGNSLQE